MENVKEWSGRMKNVEDDSGSFILGVNYSNFPQLISMLCDCRSVSREVKLFSRGYPERRDKPVSKQVKLTL